MWDNCGTVDTCRRWSRWTFSSLATSFLNTMHHFYIRQITHTVLMSLIRFLASPPALQSPLKNIILMIKQQKLNRKYFTLNLIFRKTNEKLKEKTLFSFLCIMLLNRTCQSPQSLENVEEKLRSNPELKNQLLSHFNFRRKKYCFVLKRQVALTQTVFA